jgi:hypothetical protein
MMMRYFLLPVFCCFISLFCFSEEINYSVSSIPESLLKNASVVKRTGEMQFEIISTRSTVLRQKYAYTILNEAGAEHAVFREWYDQLRSIEYIEGSLYDAGGKRIRKLKKKEIQDISGVSENNLMDDSRVKQHHFYHSVYPYTIEYESVIRFHHSFYFPRWMVQDFYRQSVQHSRFVVIAPQDYSINYRSFNYKGAPVISYEKSKKVYAWEAHHIAAVARPFAAPAWRELTPVVVISPAYFELAGYKGSMNSWKELGLFQIALNKGKDILRDNLAQKVRDLIVSATNEKEKVEILYRYLQETTRYISVQLGVGGWQPFDAMYVSEKGYGDCKALCNYMYALLKVAHIKSYYALVHAGTQTEDRSAVMEDFPSPDFNHVILCVPLDKDTVWLECTDQYISAGYLGAFTGNREALLITEEGGKLVRTPQYGFEENVQRRSIKSSLDKEGNLEMKVHTLYSAMQQDDIHKMLSDLSKDEIKKILNEDLNLSTYEINAFKYGQTKSSLPQVEEQLDISATHYATATDKRIYFVPNLLNRTTDRLDADERIFDYVFGYSYTDVDSVEIDIPEGYVPEKLPKDVLLKTKFGTYSSSTKLIGNKLYYLRTRVQYAGRYPAKDKEELTDFFDAIYESDWSRVVLRKAE